MNRKALRRNHEKQKMCLVPNKPIQTSAIINFQLDIPFPSISKKKKSHLVNKSDPFENVKYKQKINFSSGTSEQIFRNDHRSTRWNMDIYFNVDIFPHSRRRKQSYFSIVDCDIEFATRVARCIFKLRLSFL